MTCTADQCRVKETERHCRYIFCATCGLFFAGRYIFFRKITMFCLLCHDFSHDDGDFLLCREKTDITKQKVYMLMLSRECEARLSVVTDKEQSGRHMEKFPS